jgi:hypothetical protein
MATVALLGHDIHAAGALASTDDAGNKIYQVHATVTFSNDYDTPGEDITPAQLSALLKGTPTISAIVGRKLHKSLVTVGAINFLVEHTGSAFQAFTEAFAEIADNSNLSDAPFGCTFLVKL